MSLQNRWDAQKEMLEQFTQRLCGNGTPRCDTATLMLEALRYFADSMFGFFEKGFSPSSPDNYKLEHRNATPEYVYGLLSDQVSYDLDAILRAYFQRQIVDVLPAAYRVGKIVQQGTDADKLAYEMLKVAMKAGIVASPATVFTYFQKSLTIRLLPYVRVAMIGVPFNAIGDPVDYLAVAHEVGHYVYRNSNLYERGANNQMQVIHAEMEQCNQWYSPWLEEIVADVFGCMIAGPSIAKSFQNLALKSRRNFLAEDDGRHPAPVLRPYIYIDTLKRLSGPWATNLVDVAMRLKAEWEASVGASYLDNMDIKLPGLSGLVSVAEARTMIDEMVIGDLLDFKLSSLVAALKPDPSGTPDAYLFRQLWGQVRGWNGMFPDPSSSGFQVPPIDSLRQSFDAASSPPELQAGPARKSIILPSPPGIENISQEEIPYGETHTRFDDLKQKFEEDAEPIKESKWAEILTFGGWIEVGPSGGTAH